MANGEASMIQRIAAGDIELALHSWVPAAPRAVVFYVHGVQSHAGWLSETGSALASKGVAMHAIDRRGCGESGGPRGDTPSFRAWLDDYVLAMDLVRGRHPGVPLVLVGQSMGGAIAAGLACDGRAPYDALLLAAPALTRQRFSLSPEQRTAVLADRSTTARPIEIADETYTADPRYLAFIRSDAKMTRLVTARHRAAAVELEEFVSSNADRAPCRPSALVLPDRDPILHLPSVRESFRALAHEQGVVLELSHDRHYLEFSPWRDVYVQFVADYALAGGFRPLATSRRALSG